MTNHVTATRMGANRTSHVRVLFGSRCGHSAVGAIGGELGNWWVGSCIGPATSQATIPVAMKLSISVEMISLTPRQAHSSAAIVA